MCTASDVDNMKYNLTPAIEHMIRTEVELHLRRLLPEIIRPLVRKMLDEKNAIEFEEVNFTDF